VAGGGGCPVICAAEEDEGTRAQFVHVCVWLICEGSDRIRTVAHNYRMKSTQNYIPITSTEENFGDIEVVSRIILQSVLKK
jgi:hypothetical protein